MRYHGDNFFAEPTPRFETAQFGTAGGGTTSGPLGNSGIESESGNILETEAGPNLVTEQ